MPSPIGTRRSKSGATLGFVVADAKHWQREFIENEGSRPDDPHLLLTDPTVSELEIALDTVTQHLAGGWQKGVIWGAQFGFAFSGHGGQDGTICLKDGTFEVLTILPKVTPDRAQGDSSRLVGRLFLDSCYAGAAICQSLASLPPSVSLRDAYGAALHDEEAGEYDDLEHGLMTYVAKNWTDLGRRSALLEVGAWELDHGRPLPVPSFEYSEGLSDKVRVNLMDFDLVPFLSDNEQHILDVMNTRILTVRGRGELDLSEEFGDGEVDAEHVYRLLEDLTRKPLELGMRIGDHRNGVEWT